MKRSLPLIAHRTGKAKPSTAQSVCRFHHGIGLFLFEDGRMLL
jgi:hypothetical protein